MNISTNLLATSRKVGYSNIPLLPEDASLAKYIAEINKFPILEEEEERKMFAEYQKTENVKIAQDIVKSYLRLVVKVAMEFRKYGMPMVDLIAEGNLGLIKAVKKFNPNKGFKLATYAVWWIKSNIQEHILNSWSLVKIGTTKAHKKLFFNLNKIRQDIAKHDDSGVDYLTGTQVIEIGKRLSLPEKEVSQVYQLMNREESLDQPIGEEDGVTKLNILAAEDNVEASILAEHELAERKVLFVEALKQLNPREIEILKARRLMEHPETLDVLSKKYSVSKERIRQIEEAAMNKIKKEVIRLTSDEVH